MATRKRKKRRRRGYHTGTHVSPKAPAPINYRSGWEKLVAMYLDQNPDVVRYEYENVFIPYVLRGKKHVYNPDFLVYFKEPRPTTIIEVKRADRLTDPKVIAKANAGRDWAAKHGWVYEFWTDALIHALEKVYRHQ